MRRVLALLLTGAATLSVTGVAGQGTDNRPARNGREPAWLVRSIAAPADAREAGVQVLDTPLLPGSLMKAVTLVAALESHVIEPDSARMCHRVTTVDGRRYTCSHPDLKRPLTPAEALAHSCNAFFVSLAARLSRTTVNDVRVRLGLPAIPGSADFAAALVGLDGPRATPRVLLDVFTRLIVTGSSRPPVVSASTRRTLFEGLRGAASYGSASELGARGVPALAKTGTAPMPGGGSMGLVVAFVPADRPQRAVIVVAPGAAGRDATSIAADLVGERVPRVRVGRPGTAGATHVDTLPLEDYVAGVVAGESHPTAPDAAQQALAIAVRTFAMANRTRHAHEGYELCDTTHCQVLRPATAVSTRAARATAGRVLMFRGQPAAIFYSASCGGHSALASEVWEGAVDDPFHPARRDEACGGEPGWTNEVPAADIERALRASGRRGGPLRDLRITGRSVSGRVATLRADGFVPADISGQDFRMALGRVAGWQHLKSTLFDMRRTARGFSFTGRGSGHGVGMCVIGAGRRAENAATADEILQFYYPGLDIGRLTSPATTAPLPPLAGAAPASPLPASDVLLALPAEEEHERASLIMLLRRTRDELASRLQIAAPAVIRVTVHPTTASFSRATGQPWWIAGAADGTAIALLPLTTLRRQQQLERTVRHEVAHVLLDDTLRARRAWVREGAARYFAGTIASDPPGADQQTTCPADSEFTQPASAAKLRDAYARAEACFRRELSSGTHWREVR